MPVVYNTHRDVNSEGYVPKRKLGVTDQVKKWKATLSMPFEVVRFAEKDV